MYGDINKFILIENDATKLNLLHILSGFEPFTSFLGDCLRELLKRPNADIDFAGVIDYNYGITAAHIAVQWRKISILKILVEYNPDLLKCDSFGKTVQDYAEDNGNEEMMDIIDKCIEQWYTNNHDQYESILQTSARKSAKRNSLYSSSSSVHTMNSSRQSLSEDFCTKSKPHSQVVDSWPPPPLQQQPSNLNFEEKYENYNNTAAVQATADWTTNSAFKNVDWSHKSVNDGQQQENHNSCNKNETEWSSTQQNDNDQHNSTWCSSSNFWTVVNDQKNHNAFPSYPNNSDLNENNQTASYNQNNNNDQQDSTSNWCSSWTTVANNATENTNWGDTTANGSFHINDTNQSIYQDCGESEEPVVPDEQWTNGALKNYDILSGIETTGEKWTNDESNFNWNDKPAQEEGAFNWTNGDDKKSNDINEQWNKQSVNHDHQQEPPVEQSSNVQNDLKVAPNLFEWQDASDATPIKSPWQVQNNPPSLKESYSSDHFQFSSLSSQTTVLSTQQTVNANKKRLDDFKRLSAASDVSYVPSTIHSSLDSQVSEVYLYKDEAYNIQFLEERFNGAPRLIDEQRKAEVNKSEWASSFDGSGNASSSFNRSTESVESTIDELILKMTNTQLFDHLVEKGEKPGPVNDRTKRLYQKKANRMMNKGSFSTQ